MLDVLETSGQNTLAKMMLYKISEIIIVFSLEDRCIDNISVTEGERERESDGNIIYRTARHL